MTVPQAIEILERQKAKLPVDRLDQQNWINETATYLTSFLGPNHDQTKRVRGFTFKQSVKGHDSGFWGYQENANYDPNDKQDIAKSIIDSCIGILKTTNKLYKEPKTNFLSTLSKEFIWTIIVALLGLGWLVGQYITDVKNFDIRQENKILKDSIDKLLKITTPINPANNITNDTANPKHSKTTNKDNN